MCARQRYRLTRGSFRLQARGALALRRAQSVPLCVCFLPVAPSKEIQPPADAKAPARAHALMATDRFSPNAVTHLLGPEALRPFADAPVAFDMADPRLWDGFFDFVGLADDRPVLGHSNRDDGDDKTADTGSRQQHLGAFSLARPHRRLP